jgi:hypothetical protein
MVRQLASADDVDMQSKLDQVEMRIMEMRKKRFEATQAGRTEEANKYEPMLAQQIAAYEEGQQFMMCILQAKRAVAAVQAQGSSQSHERAPDPSTSQHPTPAASATPQATTPTTSQSTPRLATPRKPGLPMNQTPMSAANQSSPDMNPSSGASGGPGSAANANADINRPDVHVIGATPQHGHSHSNSLGQQPQMPPGVAAQMQKLVEQRGFAQGNKGLVGGNGAGMNTGAGPSTAGFGERMDNQWTGTLMWQGTDTTRNEKKEVRAQVTATAPKGNPCALFPVNLSLIEGLYPCTHPDWRQPGQKSCQLRLPGQQCRFRSFKIGLERTTP